MSAKYCMECGSKIAPLGKFCSSCGTSLGSTKTSSTRKQPATSLEDDEVDIDEVPDISSIDLGVEDDDMDFGGSTFTLGAQGASKYKFRAKRHS